MEYLLDYLFPTPKTLTRTLSGLFFHVFTPPSALRVTPSVKLWARICLNQSKLQEGELNKALQVQKGKRRSGPIQDD